MITSLLQNDWYSFTMSYVAWLNMRNFDVGYQFKNRSSHIRLGDTINVRELLADIDAVRALRFSYEELAYIRAQNIFSEGYLQFLQDLRLPEVEVEDRNGVLFISYHSDFPSAIFWETPLLQLVMAHHMLGVTLKGGSNKSFQDAHREGMKRVGEKIEFYKDHPTLPGFMEFGTRRPFPGGRYAGDYQERVLGRLLAEIPDKVLGTSNPYLARLYSLPLSGTQAHQLMMVAAANIASQGIYPNPLVAAQDYVLNIWEAAYKDHPNLLCFLPDTFTTPFFLENVSPKRIQFWKRWRQDSDDPFKMGDLIIAKIKSLRIEIESQVLVPSNGLDIHTMWALHNHFEGRIPHFYGWGGNLMNDTGYETPQVVIKPEFVNGFETVKLSDDPEKASGSTDEVNRYKQLVK